MRHDLKERVEELAKFDFLWVEKSIKSGSLSTLEEEQKLYALANVIEGMKNLITDLWEENQTIVGEFKALAENHTSSLQTNTAMGNRLLDMQDREERLADALKYIEGIQCKCAPLAVKMCNCGSRMRSTAYQEP